MNGIQENLKSEFVQDVTAPIGTEKRENNFYTYVCLNPEKPGKYVYGEYEFDYKPFYVGKGKGKRVREKVRPYNKILHNRLKRLVPIIVFLKKDVSENEAFIEEIKAILSIGRLVKNEGPLFNITEGGEGATGRVFSHKEETKKKLSEMNLGKAASQETKNKISKARKGHLVSKETREKISLSNSKKIKLNKYQIKDIKSRKGKESCAKTGFEFNISATSVRKIWKGDMCK